MIRALSTTVMVLALAAIVAEAAESYPLPADAAAIDITRPPYNAVGDGKTDCTAAFNLALKAGKAQGFDTGGQRLVYVPDGVYLIRCRAEEAKAALQQKYVPGLIGWQGSKKTILHGQSRDKTIIKLADNCPGFEDARRTRIVLDAGKAGSNDFSNSVYNITLDTGAGNPGAIGVKFHTSNQWGMFNVAIRSGDPRRAGRIGLELRANGPGPQLIKNLRVEGFDRGISIVYDGGFDTVFEHVELLDQREAGVYNESLPMAIRGLKTRGSVSAVRLVGPGAYLALVDADLRYSPPATQPASAPAQAPPAIVNDTGCLYVRNATCEGFSSAIRSKVGNTIRVAHGPKVDEWVSHPVRTAVPSAIARSLELPIEETPEPAWGNVNEWVSVRKFEPKVIEWVDERGRPQKITDWSGAVQQAIDSGARTVYFPNGSYQLAETVIVRGKVQRIIGMESHIQPLGPKGQTLDIVFRIEDGAEAAAPIVIERMRSAYGSRAGRWFDHASQRPLVLRQLGFSGYDNSVPGGKVFIEDIMAVNLRFRGQQVWMRQVNPEAKGPTDESFNIINDGGQMWVLGVKTEGPKTVITTLNGGRTELIGCQVYPNRGTDGDPAFLCIDGEQSLTYVCEQGWISVDALYEEQVREGRDGKIYTLWRGECFRRGPLDRLGGSVFVPLYSSRTARPEIAEATSRPASTQPSGFVRGNQGRTGVFDTRPLRQLAKPTAGSDGGNDAQVDDAEVKPVSEAAEIAKAPDTEQFNGAKGIGEAFGLKTDKGAYCPVVAGETVYFGDRWGRFHAIDAMNGMERWQFQGGGFCGAPAVAQGVVVFGCGTELIALEADSGKERWRFQTGGCPYFAPVIADGLVVFAGTDGFVYAADLQTGFEKWRLRTDRDVAGDLAFDQGIVFVGQRGGVEAIDVATGRQKWVFRCGASVICPVVTEGVVYVPGERIFALKAATGEELWSARPFEPTDPRVAVDGGKVYAGSARAAGLFVLNAKDGKTERVIRFKYHKYNWGAAVFTPPVIAGDVVYFSMMNSWALAAVDLKTDQPLWIKWSGYFQPPFVHQGRVYTGNGRGLVVLH